MPELGAGAEVFAVPPSALSGGELRSILAVVPDTKLPNVLGHFIIETSRFYWFWRLSAEPPRSETRYELRMMAHLAWQAERAQSSMAPLRRDLAQLITRSNRETKRLLLANVRALTGDSERPAYVYFYQDWIDCRLIGEAAVAAESAMKGGGDYANMALGKTVQILAFIFECCTGTRPTFARVAVGENANGALRMIGGSTFARFMLALFRHVDPDLPDTQVTSAVERELAKIRTLAALDPLYYRDLPNLL